MRPGKEDETHAHKTKDGDGRAAQSKALMPCPLQPLPSNGMRVNPFLPLPIKATECVQDTMDYFIMICKGTETDIPSVFGTVNPHLSLLLPFALKHSILFEAIIAVCRASILLSLGRPTFEDTAFIQHRGNAMAGLSTKLRSKDCTDDAALLTVAMLMTLEYLVGNPRGVHMHFQGLDKMLQLRGPLSHTDDLGPENGWLAFVKLGLVAYKSLGSFATGQPPEIPPDSPGYVKEIFQELSLNQPLSYPSTPLPSELCEVLARLPHGLSELCLKSRVSTQMIKLLASISAAATVLASDSLSAGDSRPQKERRQIMIQTLLSSLQRMYVLNPTPIEYYLTSGLLAYLIQIRGLEPLNLFYDPILRSFIQTLPCHEKPRTTEEQQCLIWVSISVAGALALRVVPMPDSHTVLEHALEKYADARTWPLLQNILRRFPRTDEIGAHWKHTWEMAMSRRQFLLRQKRSNHDLSDCDLPRGHPTVLLPPALPESNYHMQPEQVRGHIAGAPKSMREMGQAMGLCPFRSPPSAGI